MTAPAALEIAEMRDVPLAESPVLQGHFSDEQLAAADAGDDTISNDIYRHVLRELQHLVMARGDWGGVPLPLDGLRLVVEPNYPYQGLGGYWPTREERETGELEPGEGDVPVMHDMSRAAAKALAEVVVEAREEDGDVRTALAGRDYRLRAVFEARRAADAKFEVTAMIIELRGKCYLVRQVRSRATVKLEMALHTLWASTAWEIEAELKAQAFLKSILTPAQWHYYQMTGGFLETSARSGVTYFFRRNRPTAAFRAQASGTRMLCTLCLHPIGYYHPSFAGVMVPSDDLLAHLLLMRADERLLWRRANQHASWEDVSGL